MNLEPTAIVVAVLSGAGPISAYVLLRKLPGERVLAAVTASDKSVETMQRVNDALEAECTRARERGDRWKARALRAEGLLAANGIELSGLPWELRELDGEID